jgi:uncharacterized membrane protein
MSEALLTGFGLCLVLFVPGYALCGLLFREQDLVTRVVVSIGLSLCLSVLVGVPLAAFGVFSRSAAWAALLGLSLALVSLRLLLRR